MISCFPSGQEVRVDEDIRSKKRARNPEPQPQHPQKNGGWTEKEYHSFGLLMFIVLYSAPKPYSRDQNRYTKPSIRP